MSVNVTVVPSAPVTSTVTAGAPWPMTAPSATGSFTLSAAPLSFAPQATSDSAINTASTSASSFVIVFFISFTPYRVFLSANSRCPPTR